MRREPATDLEIAELARRQFGVVTRAQLVRRGLTVAAIDHRVRAGRLHRLHRGVYAVGHRVLTIEGRWMAATFATGGVLSHATAAAAWDMLPSANATIHVTVTGVAGRERRRGIRVHRSATLEPHDTTTRRGIPITTPVRTVLDVANGLGGRRLEEVLDRAERLIDFADLAARLEARPTRPGAPSLQAVLSHYTVGSIVTAASSRRPSCVCATTTVCRGPR